MTPEQEILIDIVQRVRMLCISLDEILDLAGPPPAEQAAFDAMGKIERVASTAVLKAVEQLEDQLARLFRTILQALAIDTTNLFVQDIAHRMEQLEILTSADAWVAVVKLRNRLVHDYPLTASSRLVRLQDAHRAAVVLRNAAARALTFLTNRGLLP